MNRPKPPAPMIVRGVSNLLRRPGRPRERKQVCECARRARQIAAGTLTAANGLVRP